MRALKKSVVVTVAALVGASLAMPRIGAEERDQTAAAGRAVGTLTVGTSKIQIVRAYAFPEPGSDNTENYRLYLTSKALTPEALKLAATAGADEGDRQQLALELSESKVYGLEVVVGQDKRVLRVNAYSPEATLGVMIIPPTEFTPTALDGKVIAGRLSIASHQDARLNTAITFQVTFSATVQARGGIFD